MKRRLKSKDGVLGKEVLLVQSLSVLTVMFLSVKIAVSACIIMYQPGLEDENSYSSFNNADQI